MAWSLLPTNYTDAVWSGLKKYSQQSNPDGTVSFQDVTVYSGKETSFFGAKDANRMNEALNTIMSMVENGTNLYEAFQIYFADQKELFKGKSDAEFAEFVKYLTDLETTGFTSLTEIANRAEGSATAAKTSETNARKSELTAGGHATAAKTSEDNALAHKNASVTAQLAAEAAQKKSETAYAGARISEKSASDLLDRHKEIAVRTPYVGTNGNWFTWNNDTAAYEDSGTKAQGVKGDKGNTGAQGLKGDKGDNGVALSADGIYAFNIDQRGHLIVSYTGNEAPNFKVNEQGHLIYTI